MKPPSAFPLQTPHYGRGRGRTGRFRLSILPKPGRRGTGTQNLPFPLPQPLLGTSGRGDTPWARPPAGTGLPTPKRRRDFKQNQLSAAPRRNQPGPGPPGKSGWPLARDVSHEPRSGPAAPAQPRHPLPARLAAPRGARPAVSPPPAPSLSPLLLVPRVPKGENPTPAASQQLHFLNERLMRGVNQWPLPPAARAEPWGRPRAGSWWQCHCPHGGVA